MTDVLSFDAIDPDRAFVRIGDQRYQLALPGDLGLVATVRVGRIGRLLASLEDDPDEDPSEMDKLHRVLREGLRIVLPAFTDAPCEYVDGQCVAAHVLNDFRSLDVIEAFNREAAAARRPQNRPTRRKAAKGRRPKTSIGAKSSPGSIASGPVKTG